MAKEEVAKERRGRDEERRAEQQEAEASKRSYEQRISSTLRDLQDLRSSSEARWKATEKARATAEATAAEAERGLVTAKVQLEQELADSERTFRDQSQAAVSSAMAEVTAKLEGVKRSRDELTATLTEQVPCRVR
jgi:hypothetical protein